MCTPVFIAALYTILPKHGHKLNIINEGIDHKMWCIYTIEYYSAIKKNEIMPFAATWMHPEIIMLSEVSQRQISDNIIYMWNI